MNHVRETLPLTCSEDFAAAITPGCESGIVTIGTIDFLVLGTKRLVHQRHSAFSAQETGFMPMFFLIRQIL